MSDANRTEGEVLALTNQAAQPPISADVLDSVRRADVSPEMREKALDWLGMMMTAAQTTGHPWTDPHVMVNFPHDDPIEIVFQWDAADRSLIVFTGAIFGFVRSWRGDGAYGDDPSVATMSLLWMWVYTGEWS